MLPLFVRSIKFLIGLAFIGVLMLALLFTVIGWVKEPPKPTAEEEFHLAPRALSLDKVGMMGVPNQAQLQRGFQVYKEVCSACHSLGLASFRELKGLGYNDAQAKKIAKDWQTKQPTYDPKTGDRGERDNTLADRFPHVGYAGNGTPPDLTLIAKARHGGAAYVYSLLTGYTDQKGYKNAKGVELLKEFPGAKTPENSFFNPYFANLNIAMPPPLTDAGQVNYLDGTKDTKEQKAKDIAAFLQWVAEPTAQQRKETGFAVLLFLLLTTFLAYGAYQTVWRNVKH